MSLELRPSVDDFEQAVAALFLRPTFFLNAFVADPKAALDKLQTNPARFGALSLDLGHAEIERRLNRVLTLGARLAKL